MTTEWPFLNLLTHTLGPSSLTFQGVVNSADYSSMIDGEQAIKSEIEEKLIDCAVREENIIEVIDVPSSDEDARCTSDFAQNENDMLLNMTNETQSSYVDVRPSESELSLKTEQVDYCIEDDHNGHVSLKEDNNHYEQREIPLISNVTNECFLDCHFEEVINQDSFDEHLEILEDGICEQSETICDITEELIQNCESEEAKNDEFLEERVDVSEDSVSEEMCFEYLHNNGQDVKCKIEPITSEIDSSVSGGVIKNIKEEQSDETVNCGITNISCTGLQEKLQIPFNYNWRREVVQRASSNAFDVYYYAPSGKKLRSFPDVEQYLKSINDPNVTISMFTFVKRPISNSPLEVQRIAKTRRPKPKGSLPVLTESNDVAKKRKSVALLKGPKKTKKLCSSSTGSVKHQESTILLISDDHDFTIQNVNGNMLDENPRCSTHCPGQDGIIPSLQCCICCCLFHPICVGVCDSDVENQRFTCKDCLSKETNSKVMPKIANAFVLTADQNVTPRHMKPMTPSVCVLSSESSENINNNLNTSLIQGTLNSSTIESNGMVLQARSPFVSEEVNSTNYMMNSCLSEHSYYRHKSNPKNIKNRTLPPFHSMNMLHSGYENMLKIFSYLSVPELMKAALVCRTWRSVVSHPCLWKDLNFRNAKIRSWNEMVNCVQRYQSQRLDLRGIHFPMDNNKMWKQLESVIPCFKSVTHLQLGKVPVSVIHCVGTNLIQLRYLTVEWLVANNKNDNHSGDVCSLNLAKLSKLRSLEKLKIIGVTGISLINPLLSIQCLRYKKKLRYLSLTSLKGVRSPDFDFLRKFKCLTSLELGDCTLWDEKTYASFGVLRHLERLRLEFGGKSALEGLKLMLKEQLRLEELELILFQIPADLGCVLSRLQRLKAVTIWPDLSFMPARNNYNTLNVLEAMPSLKTFTWGVVISALTDQTLDNFDFQSSFIPILVEDFTPNKTQFVTSKITSNNLMSRLKVLLPTTKVQILMMPNSFYTTIKYSPR